MSSYHVRETCRLCDAKLPDERVLDLGETCLANELVRPAYEIKEYNRTGFMPEPLGPVFREQQTYPLYLKACSACGHVQLPVEVDPALLFPPSYPYSSSTGASFRAHLDKMAEELSNIPTDHYDPAPLVVEIGSNDGYLLRQFERHGCRVMGVDPATDLARKATEDGFLTLPYFFTPGVARAILSASDPANLVVANNVFAHCADLSGFVDGVKEMLADVSGRFVFEVGWLADVVRANNFGTVYHEHLSYHSARPLAAFFERHGLELYDVQRVDTQGGSIRCFVGWPGFNKGERAGMLEIMAAEEKWCTPAALSAWQSRVDYAANAFASELTRLKMAGKTIAAYGCSAKSTTLLHVAGIGRETIDFICDDAPTKVGKFSPGKHIPIVHGSWLEEKQPDYCVSLSGNFSEAFKAQHPEYRGEWIEPDLTGGA